MTLTTMIAELEEALKAATPGPWEPEPEAGRGAWIKGSTGEWTALSCGDTDQSASANARLIALMRTHLPALIEAVKRQGEALNYIVSIGEGHGSNYDFERILDMRDAARAALGEDQ